MKGHVDWLFFLRDLASFSLDQLVLAGKGHPNPENTSTLLLAFTSIMLQYNQDVTDIIDGDFYIINKEQLYMNPFNRQKSSSRKITIFTATYFRTSLTCLWYSAPSPLVPTKKCIVSL